jgi:hypothetical protein
MEQSVRKNEVMRIIYNDKGVSLVEVMIALVVLLLIFIGLLQAALLGIDHNMRNLLREEAVSISAQRLEEVRNRPFNNVVSDSGTAVTIAACTTDPNYPVLEQRNFRNMQRDFGSRMTVTDILEPDGVTINTKQIVILVRWEYKNECYSQTATTVRRR